MFRAEVVRCILGKLNNRSFWPAISGTSFKIKRICIGNWPYFSTRAGEGFAVGCRCRFGAAI